MKLILGTLQKNQLLFLAKHYFPHFFIRETDSLSRTEIQNLFKDCGALFVYKLNGVVLKATDNLVLSTFIGLSVVGLYSNYLMFYTTIKTLLNQLYNAVKASMGNLFATGKIARQYHFFQVMNYLTVILYGTAASGIAVCADELITVWLGSDYTIGQPFSVLIGIEILFVGLKNNLGQIRNVSGAFRQMWFRPVLGVIINLSVSVILVQRCGIYGVIIGTICADMLTNFLVDPSVIHKYSFQNYRPVAEYYKKNLSYFFVLALICSADFWICSHVMTGHGWISVCLHILWVGVTVPSIFLLCWRKSSECCYLISLAHKIFKKFYKRGVQDEKI